MAKVTDATFYRSKRQQFEIIRAQLENERSSFLSHWRDLGDHILPRRPRFSVTDVNKGDKRNQKIIDSTATMSIRTLMSGMMSGVTSPARPWFRLTTPEPAMAERAPVKMWLYTVGNIMSTIFLKSNLYNVLPIIYGDMGTFGSAAMFVEEDMDDHIRFYPMPIGSYFIANNHKMKVDLFIREFRLTIRQAVMKWGRREDGSIDWSKFSLWVKNQWDNDHKEAWVDIIHIVKKNDNYDPRKLDSKYKQYISCYYERGSTQNQNNYLQQGEDKLISEKGYDFFPVLCPRWEVNGEDAYGTNCPGMLALGDIKQLQLGEKRVMQAIEKMVNPPLAGPTALKTQKVSLLPGDITYQDVREGMRGLTPIHEVNPRIQELEYKQNEVRQRIKRAFFEDLFLMLASSDRRQITAREIEERHEEKLLALGPVLEQLNQDLLNPLIDIAFNIGRSQGLFPQPPPELDNVDLKVEYISVMAQAQKLVGLAGVERFAGFAQGVVGFNQESLDKIDTDQLLDVYADATSIPPNIIRSDEVVADMRQQRAQAAQQKARTEQLQMGARAAKDFSQAKVGQDGENVLDRIISNANAGQLVQGN